MTTLLSVALSLSSGCEFKDTDIAPTLSESERMGELNTLHFSYSCQFRDICGFNFALQQGSDETLHIVGDYRLLRSSVISSDESVLQINAVKEASSQGIIVDFNATGSGRADLQVVDTESGVMLDVIELRVREATSIEFAPYLHFEDAPLGGVWLSTEDTLILSVLAIDEGGDLLQTRNGILLELPNLDYLGLRSLAGEDEDEDQAALRQNPIQLFPRAVGETTLRASTISGVSVSQTLPLSVEAQER